VIKIIRYITMGKQIVRRMKQRMKDLISWGREDSRRGESNCMI
jgi:hypothetical protein